MTMRMEKRREGIVSLTQTEVMLVLAVAIMLLLLAKHADLAAVCAEAPEVCRKVLLSEGKPAANKGTAVAAGKSPSEEELDKEVTGNLTRTAGNSTGEESALVQGSSTAAGQTGDVAAVRQKEVQKLKDDNAQLQLAQQEKLALDDSINELRDENSRLRDLIAALKKENADSSGSPQTQVADRLRDEVGFLPCWPGSGKPRYYFTFALTYFPQSDTFSIKRHSHWNSKAAVVQAALTGGLRVLNDYPKTAVSRATFLQFARKVRAAKNRLYGQECQLAVTINKKDVDLTVTNDFINNRSGFYPVGR